MLSEDPTSILVFRKDSGVMSRVCITSLTIFILLLLSTYTAPIMASMVSATVRSDTE